MLAPVHVPGSVLTRRGPSYETEATSSSEEGGKEVRLIPDQIHQYALYLIPVEGHASSYAYPG
jgi:hypothetical protein